MTDLITLSPIYDSDWSPIVLADEQFFILRIRFKIENDQECFVLFVVVCGLFDLTLVQFRRYGIVLSMVMGRWYIIGHKTGTDSQDNTWSYDAFQLWNKRKNNNAPLFQIGFLLRHAADGWTMDERIWQKCRLKGL